jgi:hypothetical protein
MTLMVTYCHSTSFCWRGPERVALVEVYPLKSFHRHDHEGRRHPTREHDTQSDQAGSSPSAKARYQPPTQQHCLSFIFRRHCGLISQSRRSTAWATPPVHFALSVFEHTVSWIICLGWPPTVILLISVSRVTSITGVSHQHLAWC